MPAFARLCADCQASHETIPYLVVAGAGDRHYEQEVHELAERLAISPYVLFPGLVTGRKKLALLHHCEFMVLPSRGEGMPLAVLEALACGKPVILTSSCYLPEVAEAGAGLAVGLDPDDLAGAMHKLWRDPGLRQTMGERALWLVKDKFNWEQVAGETVKFCGWLLNKYRGTEDAREISS